MISCFKHWSCPQSSTVSCSCNKANIPTKFQVIGNLRDHIVAINSTVSMQIFALEISLDCVPDDDEYSTTPGFEWLITEKYVFIIYI